jgi:molybdopterin synthase catalytic subunit
MLVRDLKNRLVGLIPALLPAITTALCAINHEFAFDDDPLPAEAEIAFFPPVSGGSLELPPTILSVTTAPLNLDQLIASITLPSTGAACLFTGMVRGITVRGDPHETIYLEYEAYQVMAETKLRQVADEIRSRWPTIEGIAIVQRIGRLLPGTPTVLIAVTAPHRDTGVFEAARYGIDRLKEIVPVWKKEVSPDGQAWIEGDYHPGPQDQR